MEKITIQNFRKIKESWELNLAPITFLTGTNNSGKSSVMKALMLLDGFGNSKNHFELNFNQKHFRNHKIDCFSNTINRQNLKESFYDVNFSIENSEYIIDYYFYPANYQDVRFEKGKLKSIKFINKIDNSVLSISNLVDDEYLLTIDDAFIKGKSYLSDKYEEKSNELAELHSFRIQSENEIQRLRRSIKMDPDGTIFKNYPKWFISDSVEANIAKIELNIKKIDKKIKDIDNNKKIKDTLQFNPTFNLKEFEGEESFSRILRRVLNKYFREKEKEIGLINVNREMSKISMLADNIVDSLKLNVSHLSPNRNMQTRLYLNHSGSSDIYDIIKSLSEKSIKSMSEADIFIKKWMSKDFFDIGEDYNIKLIEGLATKIEIKEKGDWINLVDKGFGAGQIFTILLRIAEVINQDSFIKGRQKSGSIPIILIEEPEANLHPAFQSLLAQLFLETWKEFDIQFIIETHSEYIIRNSQLLFLDYSKPRGNSVRPLRFQKNAFVVYYFDKDGPYEMKYLKDGSLSKPFGEGFLDVVDDIALEIFLKNNKQ